MNGGARWSDIFESIGYKISPLVPVGDPLLLSFRSTTNIDGSGVYIDGKFAGNISEGLLEIRLEEVPSILEIRPKKGEGEISRVKLEVGVEESPWIPAEEDQGKYIVEKYDLSEPLIEGIWYTFSGEFSKDISRGELMLGNTRNTYDIHPNKPRTLKPSEDIEDHIIITLYSR